MSISIILAHPNPRSFNHALAEAAAQTLRANGYDVVLHDLCAEGFDPILPAGELVKDAVLPAVIKQHCDQIVEAEGIIVIHPNWWGQPPAILKGWLDRVLRMNVAYKFLPGPNGEGVLVGLLKAKAALVFTTSNTPPEKEMQLFGDPLQGLWKDCVFDFCGVKQFRRTNYSVVITSTPDLRQTWLDDARKTVDQYFPKK